MSDIAPYSALTKLGLEHDAAKEAVADVVNSKKVATKADMKNMATKTDIAELRNDIREILVELKYLHWLIVIVVGIAVGIIKYL